MIYSKPVKMVNQQNYVKLPAWRELCDSEANFANLNMTVFLEIYTAQFRSFDMSLFLLNQCFQTVYNQRKTITSRWNVKGSDPECPR